MRARLTIRVPAGAKKQLDDEGVGRWLRREERGLVEYEVKRRHGGSGRVVVTSMRVIEPADGGMPDGLDEDVTDLEVD